MSLPPRSIKRFTGGFLVALSLAAFALLLSAAGPQKAKITFIHKERSLQPGEVILVEARSSRPLKQLRVTAFGRAFRTFAGDESLSWTGLVGIDLETKPGRYDLNLSGTDAGGESVTARDLLVVKAKKFPTRELTVDEKFVTPPADVTARIKRERERVNGLSL